jgi:porin
MKALASRPGFAMTCVAALSGVCGSVITALAQGLPAPPRELPRESVAAHSPQTAGGATPATPDGSYWTQEWGTGDWGGRRQTLRSKGVALDLRLTQSYQGVSTDALQNEGGYGGKFDTKFSFEFGPLVGWQGLSGQVITETRFGEIPTVVGTKLIPTTYLITPKSAGTVFAVTAVNVTQLVAINRTKGDFLAIGAGKYMGFDGADSPFHGGGGHTTFLHLAFNGTPTHGRLVPSVTNGANVAWVRKGNPFLTFSVRDATGHPTTPGITDMFKDGATFISGISVPTKFRGRSGKHSFTGMITTKEFTPFDQGPGETPDPVLPSEPLVPRAGSWIVQYKFFQYVSEHKAMDGTTTGWGVFGTLVGADGETNKSGAVLTVGIGGTAPFRSRPYDRYGIAYSQDGVSFPYRDQARPFDLNSENVLEAFYGFAFTRFIVVTADLQVIRPMVQLRRTAVLPGVRMVVNF